VLNLQIFKECGKWIVWNKVANSNEFMLTFDDYQTMMDFVTKATGVSND